MTTVENHLIPHVRFRTIDGVRIRYADSGSSPKPAVVLTSPWPESVYVPLANAEFLDQRLPASRLVIIDAGHFVGEEEPAQYAAAILDSITASQS
jgi:hypothetical protein